MRLTCLADALTLGVTTGLWGGVTHSERQALRRHHPDVHDRHGALTSRTPALAGKEGRT
ncbi:WhiB family transcriptional regulator [Nocardiopsis sp. Huas11]|uniref:WhiB family transcriptional regulator n=1 Tax=Nocardiopsis sp. Huas11 TaxID=2183912 RepID=UPI00272A48C9|nr:WhiB family transcriptional regulator [Nocardiopsis sp. Huas11]